MKERTNVIKLKFLRGGKLSGREYTYFTPEPVEVGDMVDIAVLSEDTRSRGIVTAVNMPYAEIEPFKDRAKTIVGKTVMQEGAGSCLKSYIKTGNKPVLDF